MASRACLSILVLFALLLGLGCGKKAITLSRVSPSDAAAQALALYDTDKDGSLDATELKQCPGLLLALKDIDKDGDGKLSRQELENRFDTYLSSKVGLQEVLYRVLLDEEPLIGATVTFEPEPFLGSTVKPATGTTNEKGQARMKTEGEPLTGCNLGVYKVRISKMEGGQEKLPARYNAQTMIGLEVSPSMRSQTVIHLSSKQ